MGSKKFQDTKQVIGTVKASNLVIEQPKVSALAFEIAGIASLIQNNFSQKAVEQMLRKHMGINVQKEPKVPRECIESATIRNTAGAICIPPTAIKKAILTASAALKGFKKTQLRTQLLVEGSSIPITFDKMVPRMDMVRTSGMARTPDVRFRPSFIGWKARVVLSFSDMIAPQSLLDLLYRAGSVGVGEWRPEKDGTFGTFKVSRNITAPAEVADVREACAVPLVPLVIPEWAMDLKMSPEILAKIAGGRDLVDEDGEEIEDEDEETGTK
jgi:hypothetical protein